MTFSLVRISRQLASRARGRDSLASLVNVTFVKRRTSQEALGSLVAKAQRSCWFSTGPGGGPSKTGGGDYNDTNETKRPVANDDIDFFGVDEYDGPEGLGEVPELRQERQFAGIAGQLSGADKRILTATDEEHESLMLTRLQEHWSSAAKSKDPKDDPLNQAGQRVRETEAALNRLGRSPAVENETLDNNTEVPSYDLLSEKEFQAFSKYVQEHRDMPPLTKDDVPTQEPKPRTARYRSVADQEEDELATKWLSARAAREMDDGVDDNPYADTMPGDMSPSNLVNRRRAKRIPKELIHHQNLYLLRTFLDPVTALIRPRVQTRLGARDQRKIAKMVKRARALGLIPYVGQFKVERTGWIHDPDIDSKRPWEVELEKAGLKLPPVTAQQIQKSSEERWK